MEISTRRNRAHTDTHTHVRAHTQLSHANFQLICCNVFSRVISTHTHAPRVSRDGRHHATQRMQVTLDDANKEAVLELLAKLKAASGGDDKPEQ